MGIIFKALEKSKNKIADIAEKNDEVIVSELKPNSIKEYHSQFLQNNPIFTEEYIIKSPKQPYAGKTLPRNPDTPAVPTTRCNQSPDTCKILPGLPR